jgi:hypothetical protein
MPNWPPLRKCENAMKTPVENAMRRFKRLTNAFSKKFENHCHALARYFLWYKIDAVEDQELRHTGQQRGDRDG